MAVTFEFYASRHIKELKNRIENKTLTILAYELALQYQRCKNWDEFRHHPGSFDRFIQTALRNKEIVPPFQGHQGPGIHPGRPFPPDRPGLPPKPLPLHAEIALYDAGKIRIAGPGFVDAKIRFRPILVLNEIVGWIGLHQPEHSPRPEKDIFFRDSSEIFHTVGLIVFVLAGVVSYGLSRHILSPVNKLIEGTRAYPAG